MTKQSREELATRLGFLLLSAGCAIGLGNVWRFPYIAGLYGGAYFLATYFFLLACRGASYHHHGICHRARFPKKYGQCPAHA